MKMKYFSRPNYRCIRVSSHCLVGIIILQFLLVCLFVSLFFSFVASFVKWYLWQPWRLSILTICFMILLSGCCRVLVYSYSAVLDLVDCFYSVLYYTLIIYWCQFGCLSVWLFVKSFPWKFQIVSNVWLFSDGHSIYSLCFVYTGHFEKTKYNHLHVSFCVKYIVRFVVDFACL